VRRGVPLSKGFHTKESLARAACELLRRSGPVAAVAADNFGQDDSLRTQCDSIFASWREAIESGLPEFDDPARDGLRRRV